MLRPPPSEPQQQRNDRQRRLGRWSERLPQAAHYAAAKAELIALTSALANAWVVAGIRVNAVCPGWTRTDMTRDLWGSPAVSDAVLSHVPLNRWASAEEIAATVLFLATSTHTGTVLTVDGGLLACVDERRG